MWLLYFTHMYIVINICKCMPVSVHSKHLYWKHASSIEVEGPSKTENRRCFDINNGKLQTFSSEQLDNRKLHLCLQISEIFAFEAAIGYTLICIILYDDIKLKLCKLIPRLICILFTHMHKYIYSKFNLHIHRFCIRNHCLGIWARPEYLISVLILSNKTLPSFYWSAKWRPLIGKNELNSMKLLILICQTLKTELP